MRGDSYWRRTFTQRLARRRFLAGAAAGTAGLGALAAFGCDDEASSPGPAQTQTGAPAGFEGAKYGGKMVFAINDPPVTFDFHTQDPPGSHAAAHPAYNGLIRRLEDPPGRFKKLEPELIESWEQVDDVTTVLKVRQGVRFQNVDPLNGRELTPEDIKYNIERAAAKHLGSGEVAGEFRMRDLFAPIERIDIDGQNVRLTTAHPYAPLLSYLSFSWMQVMPRELTESTDRDRDVRTWAAGTGPFILDAYAPGDGGHVRFRRNPDYWRPGLPFADELELPIITAAETTQAKFLAGDVDTTLNFDATQTKAIKAAKPEIQLIPLPGFYVVKIYWDLTSDSPWAKDKRLRQAMTHLVPYQTILQILGVEKAQSGPVPPNLEEWALPLEELPKFDVAEGTALIRAAGYEGRELPLKLSVSQFYGGQLVAGVLAGFMENIKNETGGAVNIKVEVDLLENARWISEIYRGGARYEGSSHADWNFDDPDHSLYSYFHSKGVANSTHINNPTLDAMLDRQRRELDVPARQTLISEIQRLLLDEVPVAYLVAPDQFFGAQQWLKNYRPMILNNVEVFRRQDEWWLDGAPSRA